MSVACKILASSPFLWMQGLGWAQPCFPHTLTQDSPMFCCCPSQRPPPGTLGHFLSTSLCKKWVSLGKASIPSPDLASWYVLCWGTAKGCNITELEVTADKDPPSSKLYSNVATRHWSKTGGVKPWHSTARWRIWLWFCWIQSFSHRLQTIQGCVYR